MLLCSDVLFEVYWLLEYYTWITRLLNCVHILVSCQKLNALHPKTGRYPFPEKFCSAVELAKPSNTVTGNMLSYR
jgi:hypothetical protein